MHGLVNRAFQCFLTDSFGADLWAAVADAAGLGNGSGPATFEAMRVYDDAVSEALIAAACTRLNRSRDSLLEDLGTYLIWNHRVEPLRRLLRFGGRSFTEFLYSLEDLPGRTRLAVAEFILPELELDEVGDGHFTLRCRACPLGFGHVMVGVLRALADDYGALVVLEHLGQVPPVQRDSDRRAEGDRRVQGRMDELLSITVHDPDFHAGRRFDLAGAGAQ
ncbi:heme NO-binding domain-containing protein [Pararhodobacter sp. SW119]|uniref:heme NO-binding domain-containing protein n=1 Tax=Pararhodobacter sp. SW119 TaxID=2780075 RepID=UPI001ADEEDAC|nr:heme NO-binding domain-containing protein [Pararhodobacter sp. SW119]